MQAKYEKLNLDYYSGEDLYSDGTVEDEILLAIEENVNIDKLIAKENRWPILYHLSPIRRNLLDWIEFDKQSNLLEIGAGCGALTGLLCEKVDKVTAVELSHKRAQIIAARNKNINNLEIMVGNLNDIPLPKDHFDVITLIGVLEYAGQFTESKQPFEDFLKKIQGHLKEEGELIVAIENKFGLKYWAGAREDHTAQFFDSLENYPETDKVKTFGKKELSDLLQNCGFDDIEFYYPFPDYKMPKQIFSDEHLPNVGFGGDSPNFDMDRIRLFNESNVYNNIIENDNFSFFSNSFLVIAKKKKKDE